ncbi:hypothetical protein [Geobacter sp. 60473]|uniref:hypothetical protein n=1 Tax=Geobacter sp. 60473 TaxID=3080755 RepID=UPI002B2F9203|nr:hypothetical protein GEO60473_21240 [Geobacter sp. 60473]
MKKRLLFPLLMLLLTSCGFSRHIGNENLKPEMVTQIQKGKTTQQDILSLFGPPQTTRKQTIPKSDGAAQVNLPVHLTAVETWSYWSHNTEGTAVVVPFYAQTTTKSSNYILTVFFDESGTVIDYQTMQNNY